MLASDAPRSSVGAVIEDHEIRAMAAGLLARYARDEAARKATDLALIALDEGHVGVARTWRRILNALNRSSPDVAESREHG
jgi:hypothetical protein